MIAIINVLLTHGELTSAQHLRDIAAGSYPNVVLPSHENRASNLQSYISDMSNAIVYTCVPRPASQASFLWIENREFQIIIETFHQGHLLHSADAIIRTLTRKLKQYDMQADIDVSLQYLGDAQTYISGQPVSILSYIFANTRDNLIALLVGLILLGIAAIWLTDYVDDAVAGLITLFLLTLWHVYKSRQAAKDKIIFWRIYE